MCVRNKFKKSLPIIASMLLTSALSSCSTIADGWNKNVRGVPPNWQKDLHFGKPRVPALNPGGNGKVYSRKYSEKNAQRADPYEVVPTNDFQGNSYNVADQNISSYNGPQIGNYNRAEYNQAEFSPPARPVSSKMQRPNKVSYTPPPSISSAAAVPKQFNSNNKASMSFENSNARLGFNPNPQLDFTPSPLEPSGDLDTPPWMKENSGAFGSYDASSNLDSSAEDLSSYGESFAPVSANDFPGGKFNPPSYQEIEKMGGDPFSSVRYNETYNYKPVKLEYRTKYPVNTDRAPSSGQRRMPVMNQMVFEQKGQYSYEPYDPTKVSPSAFEPAPIPNIENIKNRSSKYSESSALEYLQVQEQPPIVRDVNSARSSIPQYQQRQLEQRVQAPVNRVVEKENPITSIFSKVSKTLGFKSPNSAEPESSGFSNYQSKMQEVMRDTNYHKSSSSGQNYGYQAQQAPLNNLSRNNYQKQDYSINAQLGKKSETPKPEKKNFFSKFVDKYIKQDDSNETAYKASDSMKNINNQAVSVSKKASNYQNNVNVRNNAKTYSSAASASFEMPKGEPIGRPMNRPAENIKNNLSAASASFEIPKGEPIGRPMKSRSYKMPVANKQINTSNAKTTNSNTQPQLDLMSRYLTSSSQNTTKARPVDASQYKPQPTAVNGTTPLPPVPEIYEGSNMNNFNDSNNWN